MRIKVSNLSGKNGDFSLNFHLTQVSYDDLIISDGNQNNLEKFCKKLEIFFNEKILSEKK